MATNPFVITYPPLPGTRLSKERRPERSNPSSPNSYATSNGSVVSAQLAEPITTMTPSI